MTYRERREARAERLRGWAATRNTKAAGVFKAHERYRGDHAFNTQPGHIPERARVNAREDRAFESMQKAEGMDAKAADIKAATDRAIYMDDDDAKERLEEKIATLEAERERRKGINKECRKHKRSKEEFLAWLDTQDERTRSDLMSVFGMYQGSLRWVKYDLSNIGGTITKERGRLAQLTGDRAGECARCMYREGYHTAGQTDHEFVQVTGPAPKTVRVILCRYAGTCGECGNAIDKGQQAIHVERGVIACYPSCAEPPITEADESGTQARAIGDSERSHKA